VETVRPNTKVMTLDEKRGQWKTWDVFRGRYSDASPDSEHMEILVAALSEKGAAYWKERRGSDASLPSLFGPNFPPSDRRRLVDSLESGRK
jgi:hypothetical protein